MNFNTSVILSPHFISSTKAGSAFRVLQIFEWWYFKKYGTSFIEQVSLNHISPLLGSMGGGANAGAAGTTTESATADTNGNNNTQQQQQSVPGEGGRHIC